MLAGIIMVGIVNIIVGSLVLLWVLGSIVFILYRLNCSNGILDFFEITKKMVTGVYNLKEKLIYTELIGSCLYCIFLVLLIWSGFLILFRRSSARKLSLIASFSISFICLANLLLSFLHFSVDFGSNIWETFRFYFEDYLRDDYSLIVPYVLLLYGIFLIFFLTRPKVKRAFSEWDPELPSKR